MDFELASIGLVVYMLIMWIISHQLEEKDRRGDGDVEVRYRSSAGNGRSSLAGKEDHRGFIVETVEFEVEVEEADEADRAEEVPARVVEVAEYEVKTNKIDKEHGRIKPG